MEWEGLLAWMNSCRKKHLKSIFWRLRAATKEAIRGGGKQRFTFQYDPSSYALNFDEGHSNLKEDIKENKGTQVENTDLPPLSS